MNSNRLTQGMAGVVFALLTVPTLAGPARTITVSGEGESAAPPDMATIRTGVVTQAQTAREALDANTEAMRQILESLQEQQVAPRDVQTAAFQVMPMHRYDERGRTAPEIVGYQVRNQVRVRVRNLPDLGKVLDALVQAGSNELSGISFDVSDPAPLLDKARERAIADARRRAGVYAAAAGVQVGRVRTISEQPIHFPPPEPLPRLAAERLMADVPVEPGEREFRTIVHVVFELVEDQAEEPDE